MSDAVETKGTTDRVRAARIAVAYIFFANGATAGNWVTRIPALMDKLDLSVFALSFAFFGAPLGAIIAMPFAGRIITRVGSRRTTRFAFLIFCATLVPFAFVPNVVALALVIFVVGVVSAFLDVAMNAHGLVVERRYGRPILSSFHAWFSLGGLAGAGTGALAAWAALDLRIHLPLTAAIALAGGVIAGHFLLRGGDDANQEERPFFVKPPRQLVALGAIAFISLLAEGAAGDWSAVYINKPLHSSQAVAALGYFSFSFLMVIGRVSGDRLTMRFGPVALTRTGGLLAAASLTAALLIGHPVAAIIGFAGMGAGLAAVVPTVFRAAGSRTDVAPGIGLASVSLIGYFGFLVGPPLIGSTAKLLGLPAALGIVALVMAAIAPLASSAASSGASARTAPLPAADD
ncbi:MAG: MFS transporter [Gaiellaceae bacterium]